MSAGLELNIANPIVLPFQSAGMSMMCPPCPEVLEHLGTHTALFITIVNNYSVGFQMQKKEIFCILDIYALTSARPRQSV